MGLWSTSASFGNRLWELGGRQDGAEREREREIGDFLLELLKLIAASPTKKGVQVYERGRVAGSRVLLGHSCTVFSRGQNLGWA